MGMPTSVMIHIHIYFALNVFTGVEWGVHRMILEMIKYCTLHIGQTSASSIPDFSL